MVFSRVGFVLREYTKPRSVYSGIPLWVISPFRVAADDVMFVTDNVLSLGTTRSVPTAATFTSKLPFDERTTIIASLVPAFKSSRSITTTMASVLPYFKVPLSGFTSLIQSQRFSISHSRSVYPGLTILKDSVFVLSFSLKSSNFRSAVTTAGTRSISRCAAVGSPIHTDTILLFCLYPSLVIVSV